MHCSHSFDHIDVTECKKRGIRVGYTPNILTDATAELTLALLLSTTRRLFEANAAVRNGDWSTWTPGWMCGNGIKNSIVGIVGFGRIGQAVAKIIVGFCPKKIIFFNRSDKTDVAKSIGAESVSYEELLQQSDFVILTCALTEDTINLINAKTFEQMKDTAILINTSRGGLVNQDDLYEALRTNEIRAAGLDVTTPEPLPTNSRLLSLDNCVVLPHIGSAEIATRSEMSVATAQNILAVLKGEQQMFAEL